MVAIYTGHIENVNQSQHVAYSNDNGVTWTKYANNPVIDLHKKDFRDPKVFWHEKNKYWVMALMLPMEHIVQFYSSPNLTSWKHLSDFGPTGDTSGVWECPDLTQVPIAGMPGKQKWLLQTSQNTSMQYFVGEFDGINFKQENTSNEIVRPDYGPDYYAAIAYNQLPANHLPTSIGWVNNWNYANDIPTTPWKSAMSLPRNLSVKKINNQWVLLQTPIEKLKQLRQAVFTVPTKKVNGNYTLPFASNQMEMELIIEPNKNSKTGIRVAVGSNQFLEIGFDAATKVLYVDRANAGANDFNENYKKLNRFEKSIALNKQQQLKLHVFVDKSIVEIFANDGEVVFTTQIFTAEKNNQIELFSLGSNATFSNIKAWKLSSIWNKK
jgi:fructan beta-fructosidase